MPRERPQLVRPWNWLLISIIIVGFDQLSKAWIRSYPEGHVIFKSSFLSIIHVNNSGAAFGILQDRSLLLTITGFIGILVILSFALLISRSTPLSLPKFGIIALGLVLGGTIGNLTDRLRYGHVTDFISVGFWPTFNIADSAVTIGIILFAYLILFSSGTANRYFINSENNKDNHSSNVKR